MLFAAPLVLVALAALPVLWWLLRVTPPAPRRERFPAVRLLADLAAPEETPARTPWWLLALRLAAAALVILGLAGPLLRPGAALPGRGPVLLAIDTGWAAAGDWAARERAAAAVLAQAARAGRGVALFATAAAGDGAAPAVSPVLPAAVQRARLAALRPQPWPSDRPADTAALAALAARCETGRGGEGRGVSADRAGSTAGVAPPARPAGAPGRAAQTGSAVGGSAGAGPAVGGSAGPAKAGRSAATSAPGAGCPGAVIYIADGLTDGPGYAGFARALAAFGPVRALRPAALPQLLLPPGNRAAALILRVAQPPRPLPTTVTVLAETAADQPMAETRLTIPAGAAIGTAPLRLPGVLRNQVARLVIPGIASAGAVVQLDERWRRRPVGLASADPAAANTPFVGALYYVDRALQPYAALHEAGLDTLLHARMAAIVLADDPLPAGPERTALATWVRRGGELIRFAGPRTAAAPHDTADPLLPVPLLAGDRALGGAMSWSQPEHLAPFPAGSPFAGLAVPADVTVRSQVLAQPSASLPARTWAALADGTPLVTAAALGRGRVVLFHVTANDAWSNLPLSGLFVAMLRRLVALSAGVASPPGHTVLAPWRTLDGQGVAGRPPAAATGLAADRFAHTPVSPRHPPGIYGPEGARRALNLAASLTLPVAAPAPPGAVVSGFAGVAAGVALGPPLIALAAALLLVDLLVSFGLRGVLRGGSRPGRTSLPPAQGAGTQAQRGLWVLAGLALLAAGPARAEDGLARVANPALGTRLGYVVTGSAAVDRVSREGLAGLSAFVNAHTAATLDAPDPVVPGRTDLSYYPLLYWPITPDAPALSPAGARALDRFMDRGGILVIDTGAAAAGGAPAPGAVAALRRAAGGLLIPPLTPLSIHHVLARTFYLLRAYPGRYAGGPVWVAQAADRGNDDVSPVVIGSADWAAAWAIGPDGQPPYATIPGGEDQRVLADRFGVNLVMYALTGSYKGDQLQMKAILQRLGP
ncbi:MAG: DUF4159 domain-containing protein [Proteobacteria bacterium]|nr:DUF4159 domain-containing protein [Pseudomonadota bacterium]